jgi:hypothetical protein
VKFISVSISSLILALFVLGVGSASAVCLDGDGGDNTLECDSDPVGGRFEGRGGNDTMTVTADITGSAEGNGGNDTITVNAGVTVTGDLTGDLLNAGNGGNDIITVNGSANNVYGDLLIAGNGGNDIITVNGTVNNVLGDNVNGNGGNDIIIVNGSVGAVLSDAVTGGNGGNDTIIIRGTVDQVYGESGDDTVTIVLGATVTSFISAQDGTDTLQFQGAGASDAEIATANTFAASCNAVSSCTGTLTFAGKTYTFDTFERLVILMQQIQQGIVPDGGTSAPSAPGVICEGAVKAFRLPNGDVEIYSGFDVLAPNGFLVGVIPAGTVPSGQSFSNPGAPLAGWSVVFNADGTIVVTAAGGGVVSSNCRV